MKRWLVCKGTTRLTMRSADIWAARARAAELGLRDPESIVLIEATK